MESRCSANGLVCSVTELHCRPCIGRFETLEFYQDILNESLMHSWVVILNHDEGQAEKYPYTDSDRVILVCAQVSDPLTI